MPSRIVLHLAAILIAVLLAVVLFEAWRAQQRDRDALQAELAATKQLLSAADSRQHDRDAQLAQTLATFAAEKRAVVTPTQIIRELPAQLPLPSPIVLQSVPAPPNSAPSLPNSPRSQAGAVIPAEDLKPLYDFAIDCKACQAKLAASQADLADERTKTTALTKERDDALRVARGGSIFRRVARAAKWFAIGAAAGVIAAKTAH
jgi:type II secretory pathway pseudopilin PulG